MRYSKYILIVLITLLQNHPSFAQSISAYKWWNPATNVFPTIEGQYWFKEVKKTYDRFPARAQKTLNPTVWDISNSSAGLSIKFKTNTKNIAVRYVVKGELTMRHMPATGVRGLDLYAIDPNGKWHWSSGSVSYGDTIEYRFSNLEISKDFPNRDYEFKLYLPLYTAVQWLEIGVPKDKSFIPMPLTEERPMVVYGTSIGQGTYTTRPGMAWTAILERNMDHPLINLGFSGNTLLEPHVIDLMTEIDASIYILDCLPLKSKFSALEIEKKITAAIKLLQKKRPTTPILLAERRGRLPNSISDYTKSTDYEVINNILRQTYKKLLAQGIQNVYYIENQEINFDINSTVDNVHANDIRMEKYAAAYEKTLRTIFKEPIGASVTTIPVTQSRDGYDWKARHNEILELNRTQKPDNVIIGNSIIHYWGGTPTSPIARGTDSWDHYIKPLNTVNLGFGWDRTENVLWRIYHGELDGYSPKNIVIMIGTNNLSVNSNEEIIGGLQLIVEAIKIRQPKATILLSGILPRRKMEEQIAIINEQIASFSSKMKIKYINPGTVLLNNKKEIDESLFGDGLHPNKEGYQKLAKLLGTFLSN